MRRLILIGLILLGLILPRLSFAAEQCFPNDKGGFCLTDQFYDYWSANGGLPVFGYPLSDLGSQWNPAADKSYPAQWLERNRFEYHAENAGTPYAVLLGLLGKQALYFQGHEWTGDLREPGPKAGCLWFDETGLNVCNQGGELGFKQYWESHGLQIDGLDAYAQSLQLFGQPLTVPQLETNSSGDTVLTQWFERARFEWHPDQPDAFKVLLGRLGYEVFMELEARASDIMYVVWESVAGRWCCAIKLNGILADGRNQHLIDTGFLPTLQGIMAASPHGNRLILRFDKDVIGVMQRDGTYLTRLVDLSIINNVAQADWAPDGQSIALAGLYQQGAIFSDRIAVIDPQGNLLWSIDEPAHQVDTPAWSADSQRLAYIRDSLQVLITTSTGATRQVALAPGQDGFSGPMFWADNDRTLLVQYTEGAFKTPASCMQSMWPPAR